VLTALPPGVQSAEAPRLRLPGGHVWTSLPCSSSLQAASRSHRARAEGASGPCRSDAHTMWTIIEDPYGKHEAALRFTPKLYLQGSMSRSRLLCACEARMEVGDAGGGSGG